MKDLAGRVAVVTGGASGIGRGMAERFAAESMRVVVADVEERVAAAFEGCPQDRLDGLSVDCGDWWFNLRPSNTEPLLRLNREAAGTGDVEARVAEVRALIVP